MDEPLNSPVVHSAQPPDFGSSFIDAFKTAGLDDVAVADGAASPITEEPKAKKKLETNVQKTDQVEKLSKSEMDIDKMFKPKEKIVEKPVVDDSDIPESIKSTKAADAFRKIKEEKAQLAKQLDEMKAGKPSSDPEAESKFKTLQSERDALSERVRLLDIERHPDFVKKYDTKITGVFDSLKGIVGTEGDRLIGLLKSPENDYRNSQIDDIVEGLSPSKKAKLGALIVKYDEINSEKTAEMSEAKSDYESIVSKYKQDSDANTASALESATKTWNKVSENARALEIFEPRENDEEWNTELNGRLSLARQIFNGENSEEDLAKAALWAAAGPKYRELLYSQVEVNSRLKAELAKYRGSQPGVSSKATTSGGKVSNADSSKSEDFVSSVMKSLGR